MIDERFSDLPVYGVPEPEKTALLLDALHALTLHHRERSTEYGCLLTATGVAVDERPARLEDLPAITVRQFKGSPFRSITAHEVTTTLRSSGTSGRPSTIHLDREAAATQSRTLARIMRHWLGHRRLPMLIADHRGVAGRRGSHSARGAGIQGMAMLGRHHTYALTDDLSLDEVAVADFAGRHGDGPVLIFGFTFVVWQHFLLPLAQSGIRLPQAVLVHGGGWKRLEGASVDRDTFRAGAAASGIERVHDYYGLVEQTGSIFVECEKGHLHTPVHADVIVRDPATGRPVPAGEVGLLQVMSVLPTSYPGHVLLTEDLGRVLGVDDCGCGRLGRHFEVLGRLPRAEARGCSDAFASSTSAGDGMLQLGGAPVEAVLAAEPIEPFHEDVVSFLRALSTELRSSSVARAHPSLGALGFWLRDAGLSELRGELDSSPVSRRRTAAGVVLHLTPGNVDVLFAYVWALSMLSGNADVVRLSRRDSADRAIFLDIVRRLLDDAAHASVRDRIAMITYDHDDAITEHLSRPVDRRVIWGGDETVAHLRSIPTAPGCRDVVFPNRVSAAIVSSASISASDSLDRLVERFHRDAYGFDQKACSSPSLVLWLADGDVDGVRHRFWAALARHLAERDTDVSPAALMDKLVEVQSLARTGAVTVRPVDDPRLHVVELASPEIGRPAVHCGGGLFHEAVVREDRELAAWIDRRVQTVTCVGGDPGEVGELLRRAGARGPDRIVPAGQALDFDVVWDGVDVFEQLTRTVRSDD